MLYHEICALCNGKGKVDHNRWNNIKTNAPDERVCHACNGKGIVFSNQYTYPYYPYYPPYWYKPYEITWSSVNVPYNPYVVLHNSQEIR